jgi:hypothetical protein
MWDVAEDLGHGAWSKARREVGRDWRDVLLSFAFGVIWSLAALSFVVRGKSQNSEGRFQLLCLSS